MNLILCELESLSGWRKINFLRRFRRFSRLRRATLCSFEASFQLPNYLCSLQLTLSLVPRDDGARPRSGALAGHLVAPVSHERRRRISYVDRQRLHCKSTREVCDYSSTGALNAQSSLNCLLQFIPRLGCIAIALPPPRMSSLDVFATKESGSKKL